MTLLQQLSEDLKALVARAAPAVVGLEHDSGQGTGFVIAEDGYILTNHHVVAGASSVKVRLSGHSATIGTVVGSDPPTDLALVRTDAPGLTSLPLASERPVEVGELVVAIGNPYRFERSVSLGVVSALDRTLPTRDGLLMESMIQTDAAVNPGNSGGPLLDAWGSVVGVTTALVPFAQGIGLAVSARTAGWVAGLLMQRGSVERPYLGIAARGEALPEPLFRETGRGRGVRVLEVQAGTPAAQAELKEGDLLLSVNDQPVGSVGEVQRLLVFADDPVARLDVLRGPKRQNLWIRPRPRRAA